MCVYVHVCTYIGFSLHTDIPIKVIASFNRMKELTSDLSLILQAIRNSSLVEVCATPLLPLYTSVVWLVVLIQLSEDGDMLRRCVPLQEIAQTDVDCRTIYVVHHVVTRGRGDG